MSVSVTVSIGEDNRGVFIRKRFVTFVSSDTFPAAKSLCISMRLHKARKHEKVIVCQSLNTLKQLFCRLSVINGLFQQGELLR